MKTLVPTSFGQCAQMSPTKINKLVIKKLAKLILATTHDGTLQFFGKHDTIGWN